MILVIKKGLVASKHGVEDTAGTPQVYLLVVHGLGEHLRSTEGFGACVGQHLKVFVLAELRDVEICYLYLLLVFQH